ncbi:MAG: dihydroorotate dehydrogenase electron transfer subunit [Pirellulales bacterium]
MAALLHPTYCADGAVQQTVTVLENTRLARDTYRVRFGCPELAERITPGQFVMLRLARGTDPLLGRPLALYDTVADAQGRPTAIDVVYLVKGRLTSRLVHFLPGQELEVWGPLGNGFPVQDTSHLIMVAGGIGQTPFLALAAEHLGRKQFGTPSRIIARQPRVTFCYGARQAAYLAGVEDFERLGVDVRLATDDGSRGHHGLVTDLLRDLLAEAAASGPANVPRIVCCGPEIMMARVAEMAAAANVPCQVSLETPMACGIGICFTCVAKVRDTEGGWDYKRTCVEGPIFDATRIEW